MSAQCAIHLKVRSISRMIKMPDGRQYRCKPSDECFVIERDGNGVCDLCGAYMDGTPLTQHWEQSHGSLLKFCDAMLGSAGEEPASTAAAALPPSVPADVEEGAARAMGLLCCRVASLADGGEALWATVRRSVQQLNTVLCDSPSAPFPKCELYLFGSCVTMGCWDGIGDVDCTLLDATAWRGKKWPPADEGSVVTKIGNALTGLGFDSEYVEVVTQARVPVVRVATSRVASSVKDSGDSGEGVGDGGLSCAVDFFCQASGEKIEKLMAMGLLPDDLIPIESDKPGHFRVFRETQAEAVKLLLEPIPAAARQHNIQKALPSSQHLPDCFYLDFDISCRGHGIRNSLLLRAYLLQHNFVRIGALFLKKWSKLTGVNMSFKGFLTSYAINVLWIHYLLRKGHVEFVDPSSVPEVPEVNEVPDHTKLATSEEEGQDPVEVGKHIIGFFDFYRREFNWDEDVVSVNTPDGKRKKADLEWLQDNEKTNTTVFRERVWYRFCIEDPYEANLNLGRHMSPIKTRKVRSEFVYAWQTIAGGSDAASHQGLEALLEDRSAKAAEDRCLGALGRYLMRNESSSEAPMNMDRILNGLVTEHDGRQLADFAAYETANKVTKLLNDAYLTVTKEGGETIVKHHKDGSTRVLAAAEKLVNEIDGKLSFSGAWVPQTDPMYDANLANIFYFDDDNERVFRYESDLKLWEKGQKIIKMCRRSGIVEEDTRARLRRQLGMHHSEELVTMLFKHTAAKDTVPKDTPVMVRVSYAADESLSAARKPTVASSPPGARLAAQTDSQNEYSRDSVKVQGMRAVIGGAAGGNTQHRDPAGKAKTLVVTAPSATPAKKPAHPKMDQAKAKSGAKCTQCGFKTTLYPSKDAKDRGLYCERCWKKY